MPSGLAGGSVGQTVAAIEEEQPSHPSRRSRRLLPAGGLPISLHSIAVNANGSVIVLITTLTVI